MTAVDPSSVNVPLCRCGHGPDLHYENGTCFGAYGRGCPCTKFDPFSAVMTTDADPPVPVSDEAEAAWEAWVNSPEHEYRTNLDHFSFLAGFKRGRANQ